MGVSKKRIPKRNYWGAKRDEVACFGLEVAKYHRYMDEILKTGDSKEFKDLLDEIKSYDGFVGIYTPQTSNDIFENFNEDGYCIALYDTPEHRNAAYIEINKIGDEKLTDDEILNRVKVLLMLKVALVKKKYIEVNKQ